MKIKKMTKKDWIIYAARMLIFVVFWFGLKIYKDNRINEPKLISTEDINPGIYDIFTSRFLQCGYINITKESSNIVISICGDKITDTNVINNPYALDSIEYKQFVMKPETIGKESFYIYINEENVILLLKVRNRNSFFLENYSLRKNESLYMFCEVPQNKYERFIQSYEELEIQNRCYANIDTNRYTCFFVQ